MILLLDNFDSFTWNLFHYVTMITGEEVQVVRNDAFDPALTHNYSKVILSPGPGLPEESGCLMDVISNAAGIIPILGVCLGHQAIGVHFGSKLLNLDAPFHGVAEQTLVTDSSDFLYDGIPSVFPAGRYHSWVIDRSAMGKGLRITATDAAGNIMSVSDDSGLVKGIQYHPESVLSGEYGYRILQNWLGHTF